jgi:hypothetical protein
MNKVNWTVVGIVSVVILLIFLVGVSLLGGVGYGGWGYRGWGMMGPGMMGGWGFSPFGWIGMIFMWLIPIGFVVIAGLGIAWLVRSITGARGPISSTRTCPHCGRTAQADWRTCPFCGQALP